MTVATRTNGIAANAFSFYFLCVNLERVHHFIEQAFLEMKHWREFYFSDVSPNITWLTLCVRDYLLFDHLTGKMHV